MSTSQTARLYADSMRFARLFGIGDRVLPQDWPAFARYWRGMLASDTLVVSADAAAMARFLLTPPTPRMGPAWRWYRVMTTGLLPERLRRAFGLPWERRHRLLYATSIRSMRRLYPRLPARLRYLPAYQDAQRRLAGDDRQGLLGRVADRVITEALRQPQRARP